MDYEKEYKKLKAGIKNAYLYAQTDSTKAVLETIFPELCESEDERVRKALIRFHKSTIDIDGIKGDEIVSWLEKQDEMSKKCPTSVQNEQKPAWSEDDSEEFDIAIETLKEAGQFSSAKWLKSIKDRIQPKQEWSEEDDKMLHTIIADFKSFSHNNTSTLESHFNKCIDWLKSLRLQTTWKPSQEQIQCLHDAIEHYQTNGYPASKLNELYEQMSKIYKL